MRKPWFGAGEEGFRWRGAEATRLEALTDAVFGFAITLLIVSLEVPGSFPELLQLMRGFVPFAVCLALLVWLWCEHGLFFRRYAMTDAPVVVLNSLLLLVVLLFVFPLKFLSGYLFELSLGNFQKVAQMGAPPEKILMLYSGGYCLVMLLFSAFYALAWKRRVPLELDARERVITLSHFLSFLAQAALALAVVGVTSLLSGPKAGFVGFAYFLIYPCIAVANAVARRVART